MNIGETDADGWTYVRFGDAAKAAQDGAHEVEFSCNSHWLKHAGKTFNDYWQYRIREKVLAITPTIPRPIATVNTTATSMELSFHSRAQRDAAHNAIRAAMGQS